jgi:NOL1/NOP2/sun family putative RNA methylase
MFGKEFFLARYKKLGWEFTDAKPRQAIRENTTNTKGKNLEKRLEAIGIKLEKIPFLKRSYWILSSRFSVGATAEYLLGLYSIQEAAAQIPVTLFSSLKDNTVLDPCAAPGGKTVQLADTMDNSGIIVALDVKRKRLNALVNHLDRCHISNTLVYHLDARYVSKLGMKFDRILLDVPCSGNFASDKNWFNRRTMADIERNSKLQRQILTGAVDCLKSDGEIIYSTCSLEPEENEINIDWAIKNLNLQTIEIAGHGKKGLTNIFGKKLHFSVDRCRRIWPGKTQGFFVCKIKKKER